MKSESRTFCRRVLTDAPSGVVTHRRQRVADGGAFGSALWRALKDAPTPLGITGRVGSNGWAKRF